MIRMIKRIRTTRNPMAWQEAGASEAEAARVRIYQQSHLLLKQVLLHLLLLAGGHHLVSAVGSSARTLHCT